MSIRSLSARNKRHSGRGKLLPGMFAAAFVFLSAAQWINTGRVADEAVLRASGVKTTTSFSAWRNRTEATCRAFLEEARGNPKMLMTSEALARKKEMDAAAIAELMSSTTPESSPKKTPSPTYASGCAHAFFDLGTNIGDSIGHYVDQALDVCTPMWTAAGPRDVARIPRPHLDVATLRTTPVAGGRNPLVNVLRGTFESSGYDGVCVHGMEGNPTFTPRLRALQDHVMNGLQPRPVKHLHIHTESVVTDVDGPTKLYLDRHSVDHNFWGSSVLRSQQDVQRSAAENGGEVVAADVNGITLSTLVRNVDVADGGTIFVKMDVEGAEYSVLKEVAASGVLCDHISRRKGRVVMIVEYHNMSITDQSERVSQKRGVNQAKEKLAACGVEFGNMAGSWK